MEWVEDPGEAERRLALDGAPVALVTWRVLDPDAPGGEDEALRWERRVVELRSLPQAWAASFPLGLLGAPRCLLALPGLGPRRALGALAAAAPQLAATLPAGAGGQVTLVHRPTHGRDLWELLSDLATGAPSHAPPPAGQVLVRLVPIRHASTRLLVRGPFATRVNAALGREPRGTLLLLMARNPWAPRGVDDPPDRRRRLAARLLARAPACCEVGAATRDVLALWCPGAPGATPAWVREALVEAGSELGPELRPGGPAPRPGAPGRPALPYARAEAPTQGLDFDTLRAVAELALVAALPGRSRRRKAPPP